MDEEIKKPSFLVYYDNKNIISRLPDDEAGKLFKSLFLYGREGVKPDFDESSALAMAFDILSMAIDRDKEKYVTRCEANRKNGRKGGLANAYNNKQSLPNGKQGLANLADKDKDKGKDMDKGKDDINTLFPDSKESAPTPSGILLPLVDKSLYNVPMDKIALWRETYPAVDIEQELRRMIAWLDSNPTKRKTRRGIERFINNWLARTQDSGGSKGQKEVSEVSGNNSYDTNARRERISRAIEEAGADFSQRLDLPFQ